MTGSVVTINSVVSNNVVEFVIFHAIAAPSIVNNPIDDDQIDEDVDETLVWPIPEFN